MDNQKFYIKNCMDSFKRKRIFCFSTPLNKRDKVLNKYYKQSRADIAGMPFGDNYKDPKERILKAQTVVSRILGSKESFFMTDGINSAVLAMIRAVKDNGSALIINRNASPAVYTALKLFKIEPIILNQNFKHGMLLPPSVDDIKKALQANNKKAIGVLLSYPDKYGMGIDLAKAREAVSHNDKLLLLDCTYGAHFRFDDQTVYGGKYADIWVDGVYKTMPCLNQGVLVNVGNQDLIEKVRESVNVFGCETPSYDILSSIEFAEVYFSVTGMQKAEKFREEVLLLKQRLSAENYYVVNNIDFSCLVIDFKGVDVSTNLAERYLRSKRIYPEFNDGRYIAFRLSPSMGAMAMKYFEYSLKRILRIKKFAHTYADRKEVVFGQKEKSYISSVTSDNVEYVNVEDAEGRISACNVSATAEEFMILLAGDLITREMVDYLTSQDKAIGIKDNKILVLRTKDEG